MPKFILAFALFAFINLSLFCMEQLFVEKWHEDAGHRRIISDLLSRRQMPQVLLLGSSIIRLPLWICDFHNDKYTPPYNQFFEVKTFQNYLKETFNCRVSIGNSALDGAMISDVYFFVLRAFYESHKPNLLLLCVAPRDFADSLYPNETQTVSFGCLFQAHDLISNKSLDCIDPWQRLSALACRAYFIFARKDRFKTCLKVALDKLFFGTGEKLTFDNRGNNPLLINNPKERSIREYALRYRNLDLNQLRRQLQFLEKLLVHCASEKVTVAVINMPLTQDNKSMLPAGFYAQYRQSIEGVCRHQNVQLVDLASNPFCQGDFYDCAHLNGEGGQKLIRKISFLIAAKQHIFLANESSKSRKLYPFASRAK